MLQHLCPCCGRHCYLDEALCERGLAYKETGVIPPRQPRPDANGERKKPSEKKRQYLALDRDGRILWNLREMADTIRTAEGADVNDVLFCLRDEDRAHLLMLLEKLKHSHRHKKIKHKGGYCDEIQRIRRNVSGNDLRFKAETSESALG